MVLVLQCNIVTVSHGHRLGSENGLGSSGKNRSTSSLPDMSPGGGLSVTGCLADFSFYIFHPYGGGQKLTSFSTLDSKYGRPLGRYRVQKLNLCIFSYYIFEVKYCY